MKITLEQQNIGAAVMQIAEHKQFTAINALHFNGSSVGNAFLINSHVAVLCKYATEPNKVGEYAFTFGQDMMNILTKLMKKHESLFLGLVCVQDREICCLNKAQFQELIGYRKASTGIEETQYTILVTIKSGSSMRAYVNAGGTKRKYAGSQLIIRRNSFPNSIFEE